MLFSIIIPTRNRPSCLSFCLDSIKRAAGAPAGQYEIHVVDDGSDRNFRKKNEATSRNYGAAYHMLEKNRGMAVARNTGFESARGGWVVFLDDDIIVDDDWYRVLIREISGAGSEVAGIEGYVRGSGSGVWDREVSNLKGGAYLTCHMIYRTSILKMAGGFDLHFEHEGPYHEDHELAARMMQYGKLLFRADLKATHLPRKVNLPKYVFGSATRMKRLLNAEIYFYLKQRDRYHVFRHAPSFGRTYSAILFRHALTEIRRRRPAVLLKHPFQTVALLVASIIEQATAWIILPRIAARYQNGTAAVLGPHINVSATAQAWNLKELHIPEIFRMKRSFKSLVMFAASKKPVYNYLEILSGVRGKAGPVPKLRMFLRIDDVFFAREKQMEVFLTAMEQIKVPFMAAVTGSDLERRDAGAILKRITACGGSIGIHGFCHQGRFGRFSSEILQMELGELCEKARAARDLACGLAKQPVAFVAPFNAINAIQIIKLSGIFRVVCGGPETARFTERLGGPLVLETGGVYFPSYHPFYGRAADINRILSANKNMLCGDICITLHMEEECARKADALRRLADGSRELLYLWDRLPFVKKEDQ
jgi:glycosyltransferase involved in cell wall biosynthesis